MKVLAILALAIAIIGGLALAGIAAQAIERAASTTMVVGWVLLGLAGVVMCGGACMTLVSRRV